MTNAKQDSRTPEAAVDPAFVERWSPRSFRPDPIPADQIASLFEAARWAPSSMNEQPWLFVWATTPDERSRFASVLAEGNRVWAARAPVLLFVLARRRFARTGKPNRWAAFDTGAAWMSLALQARKLGLDTHPMGGFDVDAAHDVLRAPREDYEILAAVAVGRRGAPSDLPENLAARERPTSRKPLSKVASRGSLDG